MGKYNEMNQRYYQELLPVEAVELIQTQSSQFFETLYNELDALDNATLNLESYEWADFIKDCFSFAQEEIAKLTEEY